MESGIKAVADLILGKYAGLLVYRGPADVCDRLFCCNDLDIVMLNTESIKNII